jgi:hypothetical protein
MKVRHQTRIAAKYICPQALTVHDNDCRFVAVSGGQKLHRVGWCDQNSSEGEPSLFRSCRILTFVEV